MPDLPEHIECPPFPTLSWDDFCWVGDDHLSEWAAFQSRGGAYCSPSTDSQRTVAINVSTQDESRVEPTQQQIAAYTFIRQSGPNIVTAITEQLLVHYPTLQSRYADFLGADAMETQMPDVSSANDFRPLIGLGNIHVHTTAKDGVAYVGFELGCTWDVEHGLGAMMHMDRVVELSGADTAILEWIADRDATA